MSATSELEGDGAGFADRLVFLHGFTQTHHHWHHCAERIATAVRRRAGRAVDNSGAGSARTDDRCPTLAFVDLPGHGLSSERTGEIGDVGRALGLLAGRGTYIGYSMGGRCALFAALAPESPVERLVLVGATPGITEASERAERRRFDHQLAERLETIGLDGFLDEWLSAPMFAGLPPDPLSLAHRRRNTVAGLAHSLRAYGTGAQPSLWDELPRIRIPVLVITGGNDDKFAGIGRRMASVLPDATFTTIADAGHAAHSERPAATAAVIADWLARSG